MKKVLAFVLIGVVALGCGAAYAVAGSQTDPLISLSYLTGTYIPSVLAQAGDRVDAETQKVYDASKARLDEQHQVNLAQAGGEEGESFAGGLNDRRYKQGDAISLATGSVAMLLAGRVTVSYAGGAVVDLTAGTTVPSGTDLTAMHRYLAAENTTAVVSVSSETAVLSLEGRTSFSPSGATDYNELAGALKKMGLFAGTGTGYGEGYDLEKTPTRVEGLIMFLRLIGEEKAAQAYTGACPFVDVPDWCARYVAYAYSKGYAAGVGPNAQGQPAFAPLRSIGAGEYLTFVMRALGYRDSGENTDFTWQTVLPRARELGIITEGEYRMLCTSGLVRAHVAYLSYFALDAQRKEGGTLLEYLGAAGALDLSAVNEVRNQVLVTRIT
ncbi:MAG: hypothetical protein MR648_02320 [Clostridiales bacterium]|nr:hypothetical protein [Clostridiales bacterium]MDY4180143.1 hypothetical protein [Pseudoflavonifractor sp.]